MQIAIVSTRGIPNNYGGFEQFAEIISEAFVRKGHNVTVYNPHFHSFSHRTFNGVDVIKKYSPEKQLGTAANFIYDFLSLRDAIKKKHDIILCCGYTTAAISFLFLNFKTSKLITNVDGLEWKRNKYSKPVQKLALWFEKIAVYKSHALIADNEGIKDYLLKNYKARSEFIPYGAYIPEVFDETVLQNLNLKRGEFDVLIARMEPENSIEMILKVYKQNSNFKIAVVGDIDNAYGKMIYAEFTNTSNIIFLHWIGDKNTLNALRHYSRIYIHGHRVGGTNPSLLEAMAAQSYIVAHDNTFNKSVLKQNAFYFSNEPELEAQINKQLPDGEKKKFAEENLKQLRLKYNWADCTDKHLDFFEKTLKTF